MTVAELIEVLRKMPPDMEVIFDRTQQGSDVFCFASVDDVDEIESPMLEKFVLISSDFTYNSTAN